MDFSVPCLILDINYDCPGPRDVPHHVRRYLYVFYALIFGTLITVGASYIPFGNHAINIGVALIIASGKAFLVAGFFMHLISERKMIYGLLGFTVVLLRRADGLHGLLFLGFPVDDRHPLSMSLKAFHLIFITVSTALAFGCGVGG